jgi:hypothetical protein
MTEINFWAAQCINLESLFEQMQSNTTIKMASILFLTDSAYYPAFKYVGSINCFLLFFVGGKTPVAQPRAFYHQQE